MNECDQKGMFDACLEIYYNILLSRHHNVSYLLTTQLLTLVMNSEMLSSHFITHMLRVCNVSYNM